MDRARAVNPGFALRDEIDASAVAEICARLDGVALAVELAAARMVSMSLQAVRDRLGSCFRLLGGGRRAVERHLTLRHAVAWSYELLDEQERVALARCSVVPGGFDVTSAAHVLGEGDEYDVLDVLGSPVGKSLLTVDLLDGHARYGMLETIRRLAVKLLTSDGAGDAVRDGSHRGSRPASSTPGRSGTDPGSRLPTTGSSWWSSPTWGLRSDGPFFGTSPPSPSRSQPTRRCSVGRCFGSSR